MLSRGPCKELLVPIRPWIQLAEHQPWLASSCYRIFIWSGDELGSECGPMKMLATISCGLAKWEQNYIFEQPVKTHAIMDAANGVFSYPQPI